MGLMRGPRNIILHNNGSVSIYYTLHIINLVDFLIKQLSIRHGPSIAEQAENS